MSYIEFKNQYPNYQSFVENDWYLKSVPVSFWSEFEGIILRYSNEGCSLKFILDSFATLIPCTPVNDWSYDYLKFDLSMFVKRIRDKVENGEFHILMDCIGVLFDANENSQNCIDGINEFLNNHHIGYWYSEALVNGGWRLSDSESNIIQTLTDAKENVKSISQQAFEEFERATKSLKDFDDERARKDAVRSVASAMEAVVKVCAGENDIDDATKKLKSIPQWGKSELVKDGQSIFNTLHRLYPDLRHGSLETSSMGREEAEYWIGRMSLYVKYMQQMKKTYRNNNGFANVNLQFFKVIKAKFGNSGAEGLNF